MALTLKQWKEILNFVEHSNNSNQSDMLKQIREKLDRDTYQKWKQKNFDINYLFNTSLSGQTSERFALLHMAIINGNKAIVKYLINLQEIDVNLLDESGYNALHRAAAGGHKEIVECLVVKGIDTNKENRNGLTALHLAAINSHKEIVEYLIEEKSVNVSKADKNGFTALHWVAVDGHKEIVKYLIEEKGVDINLADKHGISALHLAAANSHKEVVEYLIEKSININKADKNGLTALHWAAGGRHKGVVKCLIEKGININNADKDGLTVLHYAVINGHIEIVEHLIEKGIDISKTDKNGLNVLHWAAANGHKKVVEYLIEKKGIDVNQLTNYSYSALHLAALNGHKGVVECLIEKKDVDINQLANNSYNALHIAVLNSRHKVAEVLIAHEFKLRGLSAEKPSYLVQPDSNFKTEMSKYWDKCLDEVKRMKEEKIDQGITFYDVLISKDNKLASYIKNKNIKKRLETGNYQTEFPLYASKVQSQYKKGKDRAILLDKGEDSIIKIVDIGCGKHLPKISSVSEKIVGYLTNDDIENLNKAAENLPKGIKRKALFEEGEGSTKYFAVSKAERCSSSLSNTKVESLCQARSMEN